MDVEWVEKATYTGYFENPLETPNPPTDLQNVLRDVEPGAEGGTNVSVTVGESDSLGIAFMTKHRNWPMRCMFFSGANLEGHYNLPHSRLGFSHSQCTYSTRTLKTHHVAQAYIKLNI